MGDCALFFGNAVRPRKRSRLLSAPYSTAGSAPLKPPPPEQFVDDSPLEGAVSCELVSEMLTGRRELGVPMAWDGSGS